MKKRSKKLLLLLATAGFAWPAAGAELLPGDYAEEGFLSRLIETRSPVAAIGSMGGGQSITVWNEPAGQRLVENDNWHEGYTLFTLRRDGGLDKGEEQDTYPLPKIEGLTSFVLYPVKGSGDRRAHHYVYVGDIDALVLRVCVAGQYHDERGKIVEFGTDGEMSNLDPALASLPREGYYSLDNDHAVGPDWDYVEIGEDQKAVIAFRHDGPNLILYPVLPLPASEQSGDGLGVPDYTHPLAHLHWTGAARN